MWEGPFDSHLRLPRSGCRGRVEHSSRPAERAYSSHRSTLENYFCLHLGDACSFLIHGGAQALQLANAQVFTYTQRNLGVDIVHLSVELGYVGVLGVASKLSSVRNPNFRWTCLVHPRDARLIIVFFRLDDLQLMEGTCALVDTALGTNLSKLKCVAVACALGSTASRKLPETGIHSATSLPGASATASCASRVRVPTAQSSLVNQSWGWSSAASLLALLGCRA